MKDIRRIGIQYRKERLAFVDGRAGKGTLQRYDLFPVKAAALLLGLVLYLNSVFLSVSAAGSREETASLQVEIFAQSDDGKSSSPVSGASLTAVQIASLKDPESTNDGSLYTVTKAAAGAGITDGDIKRMDTASSSAVAGKAAGAFRTGGKAEDELKSAFVRKAVSDDKGVASFGSISIEHFGIFVVYQTGKSRDAAKYLDIEPFLVQVPQPDAEKAGTWNYQVRTIPKLAKHTPVPEKPSTPPDTPEKPEVPGKPEKPSKPTTPSKTTKKTTGSNLKGSSGPVRTGDLQNPALWAGLFAAAGLLLIVFAVLRKKLRRKEEEQ